MMRRPRVILAKNFILSGGLEDRLTCSGELSEVAQNDAADDSSLDHHGEGPSISLFNVPAHLRKSFWEMLEANQESHAFDGFAAEVRGFLEFKKLAPPELAVFEVILQAHVGEIPSAGAWAIINMGDEPIVLAAPGLQLQLACGEAAQLPSRLAFEVVPPTAPSVNVVILIRYPEERT